MFLLWSISGPQDSFRDQRSADRIMERRSDFSVERILSGQVGPRRPPEAQHASDGHQHGFCGGFTSDSGDFTNLRRSAPVPVPVPVLVPVFVHSCPQHPVLAFGNDFYACGCGYNRFYPNYGISTTFSHFSGGAPAAVLSGHQQAGLSAQPRPCPKGQRVRTTFTDSQSEQLEALLQRNRYPTKEARTELARSIGLSEETVRVWFKNRRARRRR